MVKRTGLLDAYPLVRTDNVEELRAALARLVSNPLLEPVSRERTLGAVQNHLRLNHIGISYGMYGAAVHFNIPEPKIISQIYPIGGKAEVVVDGTAITVDGNCGAAISAHAAQYTITNTADYERLIMLVDAEAARAKLAALLGRPIPQPLTLQPRHDLREPLARSLRENFMFLVAQLNAGANLPSLILTEIEQTLMVMFLQANRHNYSHLFHTVPLDGGARQVRIAEEFISANWQQPLNIEELAAVGGLGIRSLVRSFRKNRGYSPSEFLQQLRLHHARARLKRPDMETTVSETALACGFRDLRQFGAAYRKAFGETPEDTLERSMGFRPRLH